MIRKLHLQTKKGVVALIFLVMGVAAWVLFAGKTDLSRWSAASRAGLRRPTGYPQLVSVDPLPSMNGEMCQWVPASGSARLLAAAVQGPVTDADAKAAVDADRAPVRVIRDTYPAYSAVAVHTDSDEVFLQDENLFGLNVYNRLDNTPPGASFTEPKRVISGPKTKIEYNCGLYVDPKNGDIYTLSNDTNQTLAVFPRSAKGNVAPMRELRTPQATFGLAVDDDNQELFIAVQENNSIVVYRKTASGDETPLRELVGNRTQLGDPHGVAVDSKSNLLFVANTGSSFSQDAAGKPIPGSGTFKPPSITVYARDAKGDTAPLRVIQGPKTGLNWAGGMTVDQEHGELYVANDAGDSMLVFRETDSGDVAPVRVIKGPKSGLKNPTGVFVDLKNGEVWAANLGNHSATVYPRTANGDVAPLRTIRSAPSGTLSLMFNNPAGVAYDAKRDLLLIPN